MSDVNLDFTVNTSIIDITVQPNDINITPTAINLQIGGAISTTGGNLTELQYNAGGIFGGIPTATYDGNNLSLGNVANIKITGGVNGYVLQTDGTGNLDWTLMSGNGGGNGTPGGSNTQIQYNDSGAFGGNSGFTFNEVNGNVNIPGNLIVAGTITPNNAANANFANYAGNAFSVTGSNVLGAVGLATYATTANAVAGSNVSGAVGLATYATTANAVAGSNVSGAVAYATTANAVAGANVSGTVANATYAISTGSLANGNSNVNIPVANGNVNISAAGNANVLIVTGTGANITGTLHSSGNANLLNLVTNNITLSQLSGNIVFANTYANIAVLNITTGTNVALGNHASAVVDGTAVGWQATAGVANSVAVGHASKAAGRGTSVGYYAGSLANASGTTTDQTFIGAFSGAVANANTYSSQTSIGAYAGYKADGAFTVAIGAYAGYGRYSNTVSAVGQGSAAIAIGYAAGQTNQKDGAIAIGYQAGSNAQGANSIAIGRSAGNVQSNNSITIDATVSGLSATIANSFFVKPIRDVTGNVDFTVTLKYNPTTGEIGYV